MAVERIKNIKKLVMVESVPHKVLVCGQPVSAGKQLWCCGESGIKCVLVVQTDTKKRECVLYDVDSNQRFVRTERQLNNAPCTDSWSRDGNEFWAVHAHEAIHRHTVDRRWRLSRDLKSKTKSVKQATKELSKIKSEVARVGPDRQRSFRSIASLKKAFARVQEAMKK